MMKRDILGVVPSSKLKKSLYRWPQNLAAAEILTPESPIWEAGVTGLTQNLWSKKDQKLQFGRRVSLLTESPAILRTGHPWHTPVGVTQRQFQNNSGRSLPLPRVWNLRCIHTAVSSLATLESLGCIPSNDYNFKTTLTIVYRKVVECICNFCASE